MASSIVSSVVIRGLACAVPAHRHTEADVAQIFGAADAQRLAKGTGVRERRIGLVCTSDLCYEAATRLLDEQGWARDSISHLVLITQTPDYVLPASACILQQRLGLSTHCTAFDVNLGCSGYPYGLWLISRLLEPGQRALLLVGDTINAAPQDRSTMPLFGHAGSATTLERPATSTGLPNSAFILGTDGSGARNIIVEAGQSRLPSTVETQERQLTHDGNLRSQQDLVMNGPQVFTFALQHVPSLVNDCLSLAGWSIDQCHQFVFHQANGFMLKTLADKLDIPDAKMPSSLREFGNTSSASIPLTLVTQCQEVLRSAERQRNLLIGFGVGWSWAAAAVELGDMIVPDLINVE
jgi:3-oxoacyl-[acyl-carrier-protein] synthase-3